MESSKCRSDEDVEIFHRKICSIFGIKMPEKESVNKIHYHHCPKCYDVYECHMDCTTDSDLEDEVCHPGKQFGSYWECFECEPIKGLDHKGNKITEYSKDWWEIYNGFRK